MYYPESMSDRPTISLDVEGVLADTHGRMIELYNERHGTKYSPEEIDDWYWVRDEIDFSEFMEIVHTEWNENPLSFRAFESQLGQVTDNLAKLGELDIVTARPNCEEGMKKWFDEHRITAYNQLRTVDPDISKAELGYDIYIDDKPHLVNKISGEQILCLIRRSYNTHKDTDKDRVIRAETVHEASISLLNSLVA